MTPNANDTSLTDTAAQLRHGGRADGAAAAAGGGGRGERADPDLDLGAGDDRAARPAHPQRAGAAGAGAAADRDPHPRLPGTGGAGRARPPTRTTAAAPWSASTPPAASGCGACAGARTPTWRSGCGTCRTTTWRPWSGRRRFSRACWRVSARRPARRLVSAALRQLLQLARGPQLPALLRRPAGLPLRHLDADGRGDLGGPHPHRQRRRRRPDHGAAVPADAAVRRLGRAARRPHPQAPAADRRPRR